MPLNESKGMYLRGDLVTDHSWRIHLSECSGVVTVVGTWVLSKDTHDTRFLCMTGTRTTDRAKVTTRTMCDVIQNLTKGRSSSIIPLLFLWMENHSH